MGRIAQRPATCWPAHAHQSSPRRPAAGLPLPTVLALPPDSRSIPQASDEVAPGEQLGSAVVVLWQLGVGPLLHTPLPATSLVTREQ